MHYSFVFHESIKEFEQLILKRAEQELQTVGRGEWIELAERYLIQKERLSLYPFPEEFNSHASEDEYPPVIKHISHQTTLLHLYRWGLPGGKNGNFRLLFILHNHYKIFLVHWFKKQYNGGIKREDIIPAETKYEMFCEKDPSLYPVMKEGNL